MPNSPKNILVTRLSAMGDVAMMVPVLIGFKKKYPEVKVTVLSRKRFKDIIEQVPDVQFIEAQVQEKHSGALGIYKLSQELQHYSFDAIADFHNVLRTKALRLFLTGKKAVIDKGRLEKKRLINDPNFFKPLITTHERYTQVLRNLGFEINLHGDEFLTSLPLSTRLQDFLPTNTYKWIGFAPFAAHPSKGLSVERMDEYLKELSGLENVNVFLFGGGKKEVIVLDKLADSYNNVINLAGKFSFKEELAIISKLDHMIAMDSGNGHLAAMYGVDTITVWGCTHPYAGFAPFGQPIKNQVTVNRDRFPLIPTSVYGNKWPDGYENAINTIPIKKVIQLIVNK